MGTGLLLVGLLGCDDGAALQDAAPRAVDATARQDGGRRDAAPERDGATRDMRPVDAQPADAQPGDGRVPDATVADAAGRDAAVPDAAVPDAAVRDAAVPDAAVPDAAVPNAVPDAAVTPLDLGVPDAAPLDAAPLDAAAPIRPGPPVPDAAPLDAEPLDAAPLDAEPLEDAAPLDAELLPLDAAPFDPPACPIYEPAVALGRVANPAIIEASGLAQSHRNPGVLWTHNDAGNRGQLFALGLAGEHLGVFDLEGAQPRDWEDVAVGPGPDRALSYVYQADVGDNAIARANVVIRRWPEPQVVRGAQPFVLPLGGIESFTLVYPDGSHNCETLLVDPQNGDVFLVAKSADGISPVFRAPNPLVAGRDNRMEQVALLRFGAEPLGGNPTTTGGSISPEGDGILIRTYGAAFYWPRPAGVTVGEALSGPPCALPRPADGAEAIAFALDGSGYYTLAEGAGPTLYFHRHRPVLPPTVLVDGRTRVRYRVPVNDALAATWTAPDFDDSAWRVGQQGLGYESAPAEYAPLIATPVEPAAVDPGATSVQLRLRFAVADPAAQGLVLRVQYDDGFVAWLNGTEVARRNVPAGLPTWNGRAASHPDAEARVYQDVDIQAFAHLLVPGANVLAIHAMNAEPNSSDLLVNVELVRR